MAKEKDAEKTRAMRSKTEEKIVIKMKQIHSITIHRWIVRYEDDSF